MSAPRPSIILLDLDNTLYEYAPCHEAGLEAAFKCASEIMGIRRADFQSLYDKGRKTVHDALMGTASSHNRLLYFQQLVELYGKPGQVSLALGLYEAYWDAFISAMKISAGAMDFLNSARGMGVPVVLVTDLMADIQFKKIKSMKIESHIDAVVTSEEAGQDKPGRLIFDLALKKAGGAGGGTAWMIGDSSQKDIKGGRELGAVTFLRVFGDIPDVLSDPEPDYVFNDFRTLTKMLNGSGDV